MATKRHHYVPRHYLEAWADSTNTIIVWNDSQPCRKKLIADTAVWKRLYSLTIPSLRDCEQILIHCRVCGYPAETTQILFQSCVYPLLRDCVIRGSPTPEQIAVARFIVENDLSSPDKIRFLSEWLKGITVDNPPSDWNPSATTEGLEPFMSAVENSFWPILNGIRTNSCLDFSMERHKVYLYLAVQLFRTPKFAKTHPNLSQMNRLLSALDSLLWMVGKDSVYKFKIVEITGDREFLSCDNPVVDYGYGQHELFFPVSPKQGLFFFQPGNPYRFGIDSTPSSVNELNQIICNNADEEIYATSFESMQKEAQRFGVFRDAPFIPFEMRFSDDSLRPVRLDD